MCICSAGTVRGTGHETVLRQSQDLARQENRLGGREHRLTGWTKLIRTLPLQQNSPYGDWLRAEQPS